MYYKQCPECGANLDPGESCDCKEKTAQAATCTASDKIPNHIVILSHKLQTVKPF